MIFRNVLWSKPRKDGTHHVKIYAYNEETRQKDYYQTKIYIPKSDWDEIKQEVKKSHALADLYNAKIKEVRGKIETHFYTGGTFENWLIFNKKSSLIELGEKVLQQKFIDRESGRIELRDSTLKKYLATIKHLQDYCKINYIKDVAFQDINLDFYNAFQRYLLTYTTIKEPSSVGNHFKIIKSLMNYGLLLGMHNNNGHQEKGFKVHKNKGSNKIALTLEEIEKLEKIDLSFSPALERERDRWLVAYYFLFRFSDVSEKISQEKVYTTHQGRFIRIFHKKTGKEVVLPVKDRAFRLLEQYNYDFSFTGNQQSNRAIKKICALAGITQLDQEGKKEAPRCEFVGTHTARRSAATNLYLQGVSLKMIADLGGWESEETLRVYLRASGMDTAIAAKKLDFFK